MLGCQDFCGYYDWTFSHIRREFGQQAVAEMWSEAIGVESQDHYSVAGRLRGLRGLYETWTKTGVDEKCDWDFTLDEQRNVLRWDMRKCPSKGFLLGNDVNADEDYCDHCMGWMAPLLSKIGVEVVVHEHNHCGQCWGEMRVKGKPYQPLDLEIDIRKDPRWARGYLDRFRDNAMRPFDPAISNAADPAEAVAEWLRQANELVVVYSADGRSASSVSANGGKGRRSLVGGSTYASNVPLPAAPLAVLIDTPPVQVEQIARRYAAEKPSDRPLLLYAYLPRNVDFDFAAHGLPRPAPILPLLIRKDLYRHQPGKAYPATDEFLRLLSQAGR